MSIRWDRLELKKLTSSQFLSYTYLRPNIRNNENILMLLITAMNSFKRKERETKQTPIDRRNFSDFSNPFMKTKNNEKTRKNILKLFIAFARDDDKIK